jgi:hypothetical protein
LLVNTFTQMMVWCSGMVAGAGESETVSSVVEFVLEHIFVDFERGLVRSTFALIAIVAWIKYVMVPGCRFWFSVLVTLLTGTKVMVYSFVRLVRFLASPVRSLYANHRLRRKVMHATRAKSMTMVALTGELKFDVNGPYLLIMVNGSERQVRVSQSDLACLAFSSAASNRGAEALLPGAVMVPSSPVKGQVFFQVGGKIIGSGFRTSHFGEDALITAFHVGKALADSGADFSICRGDVEVVMTSELRLEMKISKVSSELDFVSFVPPAAVFSVLGVKTMKLAKTPIGPSVNITGVSSGDMVKSFGVVSKATDLFQFRHSVSTEKGWSGAPICNESGAIVGMHVRGFGSRPTGYVGNWSPHNVGVSFDWSYKAKRGSESDINIYAFAHHDDWEKDEDDRRITLHEELADRFMDTRASAYGDWDSTYHDHVRSMTFAGFDWADAAEDMDFESSPFENASVFPIALPLTGAVKLEDTNVSLTVIPSPGPTASSSTSSAPTPVVAAPSVDPPATRPKKSRRKSRSLKGADGPKPRGKESNDPSASTLVGTSSVAPNIPATPTPAPSKQTTLTPAPGSDALSKELRASLALMVPLAGTLSPLVLSQMVSSLPSGKENLSAATKWLSERTQRNAARTSKKSAAASARSST